MKITLYFFILSILTSLISPNLIDKKQRYFEGQIEYQINYSSNNPNIDIKELQESRGSKMILTYKKGNYKKEYFSPNGKLVEQRFLNIRENKSYLKKSKSDTIYWFNINNNDSKTNFKLTGKQSVLNYDCKVIETKTIVTGPGFGGQEYKMEGRYLFAEKLPVNPKWYKNYLEADYNKIIKIGQGIVLEKLYKSDFYEMSIIATSVQHKKISRKSLFIDLDNNPKKEI